MNHGHHDRESAGRRPARQSKQSTQAGRRRRRTGVEHPKPGHQTAFIGHADRRDGHRRTQTVPRRHRPPQARRGQTVGTLDRARDRRGDGCTPRTRDHARGEHATLRPDSRGGGRRLPGTPRPGRAGQGDGPDDGPQRQIRPQTVEDSQNPAGDARHVRRFQPDEPRPARQARGIRIRPGHAAGTRPRRRFRLDLPAALPGT